MRSSTMISVRTDLKNASNSGRPPMDDQSAGDPLFPGFPWVRAPGPGPPRRADRPCTSRIRHSVSITSGIVRPLTSHLAPLTSHLSPLTSHLSPLTSHLFNLALATPLPNGVDATSSPTISPLQNPFIQLQRRPPAPGALRLQASGSGTGPQVPRRGAQLGVRPPPQLCLSSVTAF